MTSAQPSSRQPDTRISCPARGTLAAGPALTGRTPAGAVDAAALSRSGCAKRVAAGHAGAFRAAGHSAPFPLACSTWRIFSAAAATFHTGSIRSAHDHQKYP